MQSKSPYKGAVLVRHSVIEFSQFSKYYNQFMKLLDQHEKKTVLCLEPLLKIIFDNQKGLNSFRNNWVGHIQDKNKFNETMTEFIEKMKLPKNIGPYYYMILAITTFVDALWEIFPKDFNSLNVKFSESGDKDMPQQPDDIDWAHRELKAKIIDCKENLNKEHISVKSFYKLKKSLDKSQTKYARHTFF